MTKQRFDLDRSAAFTILLHFPWFADSPDDGGATVTSFLDAWYEDESLDMYEFAQRWNADPWREDREFPVADWQYEVANNETRSGYHDWCAAQREARARR